MTYGNRAESLASPGEGSTDRILSYANSFVAELCAERELSNASERPIIFVCHGFGGILVKRALVLSNTSKAKSVEHRRAIFVSTCAIIFLGTPHAGMSKEAIMMPRKGNGAGLSQFILNLLPQSEMLQDITDQFAPLMNRFSIYYFWEQLETHAGTFKAFVVEADSAAPAMDVVERCGIMSTHSGLAKFKDSKDHGYQVVLGALARCIKSAPAQIKMKWAHDQQLLAEERWLEGEEKRKEAMTLIRSIDTQSTSFVPSHSAPRSPVINELYIVQHRSSHYFTGRESYAKTLREKFHEGSANWETSGLKIFVICGLGGSGKTQFSLKYIEGQVSRYEYHSNSVMFISKLMCLDRYWGVFWIDASNEEKAESGFADLGQQAGKGATFAAGMHWLSTATRPWFLVVDNADDPDMDVSRYIPAGGKGHVLITTRNPETIAYANLGHFHFRGMDPEEAITLLLKSAHANDLDDQNSTSRKLAQSIASELGYLALALTHAGATIRRKIYTLERYLNYYLGQRKKMLSYPQISSADDANIITTWEIPFRRIASRQSPQYRDAVDIMHIFAFMHFDSIPEMIFRSFARATNGKPSSLVLPPGILQYHSVWDEEADARVRSALRVLCDHSIVDHEVRSDGQGFCQLHPVVHAWTRARLRPDEQKRWVTFTASVLADCITPSLEASGRHFRKLLLPHIDSCLQALESLFPSLPTTLEQAAQISRFALVYAENGLWKRARDLQHQVVDLRTKRLGRRHEDTMTAQSSLGYIYWNLFAVRPAIEVQYEVIRSRWRSRPSIAYWLTWPPWKPIHLSYCIALNEITLTLWLAGIREKSKQAGEKALKGLMLHYGPDDPKTLDAMFNLARTYLHLADYEQCHHLLVQVVKRRKRYFGSHHPDTLMARNELGMCYRATGKLAIAERLVSNVLQSRKRILGEEHAYTLWSINDLSKIMCDRELPQEAASMLEDIVPVVMRTLGEDHIGMSMTKSNLARAYSLCKRWGESEALLTTLLERIPAEHPDYIHVMHGYVHVLVKLKRLEEADAICNSLLSTITETEVLAIDNPRTVAIAELLSSIYQAQGRRGKIASLKVKVPHMDEKKNVYDNPFSMQ